MKALRFLIVALVMAMSASNPATAAKSHGVKSYVTKKGTYVPGHVQTNPDKLKSNNYSTKGNYNPNKLRLGKK